MHYEINVSRNGQHFFATHPRSVTDRRTLKCVAGEIAKRFPASEGFEVSVTHFPDYGHSVSLSDAISGA